MTGAELHSFMVKEKVLSLDVTLSKGFILTRVLGFYLNPKVVTN